MSGLQSHGGIVAVYVSVALVLLLLALMQFGFIFNGYITMTNAVREAARTGTLYPYDRTLTKDNNDVARNNTMRTALLASFNGLSPASPNFVSSTTWVKSNLTWTSTDLVITVAVPDTIIDNDPRQGERITVQATYHLTLFIPLIGDLLSKDGGGRLPITTESTMVIN